MKRIAKNAQLLNVSGVPSLEAAAKALEQGCPRVTLVREGQSLQP
jgi:hypothetical protein